MTIKIPVQIHEKYYPGVIIPEHDYLFKSERYISIYDFLKKRDIISQEGLCVFQENILPDQFQQHYFCRTNINDGLISGVLFKDRNKALEYLERKRSLFSILTIDFLRAFRLTEDNIFNAKQHFQI